MRKHRWAGGTLVLLTGMAMATVGALGATAETTSVQASGSSPSLSITPLDGLLQPVLQLVDQTLAPPAPAEPAAPQEAAPPAPEVQQVQAGEIGYAKTGENLLSAPAGYIALQMEASWMNSPGHRANILDPAFSVAGVGIATAADGTIWVAVEFGG